MIRKTPLHAEHVALGARMVDFGGWEMPLNYGSQIEEHHAVRRHAGMFDVSHMNVVDLAGPDARRYLSRLLANDIAKVQEQGRALYSCMLNDRGGVIDDLIVYFLGPEHFRLIANAATRDKDIAWLERQRTGCDLALRAREDLAVIAVQGPEARARVLALVAAADRERIEALGKFRGAEARFGDTGAVLFIARTGYTGEDGFEIVMAAADAVPFWRALHAAGVTPAGLGARDTLRLEAGLNLYGQDMDETVTPLEAGLAWTVAMKDAREFIGREALERQRADGVPTRLIGLVLEGKGILRHGQELVTDAGPGRVLSGSFSPTLEKAIALASVPAGAGPELRVRIRNRELPVRRVKPPFVRAGKAADGV